ncbi:MAG: hypothetical protein P4L51_10080 [Puia sp.]|nr:hypothetical protein [Puia sp.]
MLTALTLEELRKQLASQIFIKFDKRQSVQFIPAYQTRAPHIAVNGIPVGYHVVEEKGHFYIVIGGEKYLVMDVDLDKKGMIRMFVCQGKGECWILQRKKPVLVNARP